MAKRKRRTTKRTIQNRIAEGRGKGRRSKYSPWLRIQDVPSRGLVTRIKGWKSGRVHHLLSLLELRFFYILDWSIHVVDVREQFPLLPLEETLAIARSLGVEHPKDPITKHPIVMTTDFVATIKVNGKLVDQARSVKYSEELGSVRTLEKLEIERRYWQARKVDWKVITERNVSTVAARNIEWLHPYRRLKDFSSLPAPIAAKVIARLAESVSKQNRPLRDITLEIDDRFGLEWGTGLALARYLIATRRWLVDINQPINPGRCLILVSNSA